MGGGLGVEILMSIGELVGGAIVLLMLMMVRCDE
jgi:hypothetical protein